MHADEKKERILDVTNFTEGGGTIATGRLTRLSATDWRVCLMQLEHSYESRMIQDVRVLLTTNDMDLHISNRMRTSSECYSEESFRGPLQIVVVLNQQDDRLSIGTSVGG